MIFLIMSILASDANSVSLQMITDQRTERATYLQYKLFVVHCAAIIKLNYERTCFLMKSTTLQPRLFDIMFTISSRLD